MLPSSLSYGYDQLTDTFAYDPDRAVQVLDDAGIVDTDGDGCRELDGENINLNYIAYSSRNLDEFAQAVAITLESIGIGCTVTVQDYDTALANQSAGSFDLITSNAIVVPTGDPTGLSLIHILSAGRLHDAGTAGADCVNVYWRFAGFYGRRYQDQHIFCADTGGKIRSDQHHGEGFSLQPAGSRIS